MKDRGHNGTLCAYDVAHVRGQKGVKRALEVAAAGRHSILLIGSPGAGKTLLAQSLAPLLPEACQASIRQVSAGEKGPGDGELLFLRNMQTWESGDLAAFWSSNREQQVVGTVQHCPCGFYGDTLREWVCTIQEISEYQKRLAPFLNEFDIHITVSIPNAEELLDSRLGDSSVQIRARVERAYALREQRGPIPTYSTLTTLQSSIDQGGEKLLHAAIKNLYLTPLHVVRTVRIARTIADLYAEQHINANAIAEALQYRVRNLSE